MNSQVRLLISWARFVGRMNTDWTRWLIRNTERMICELYAIFTVLFNSQFSTTLSTQATPCQKSRIFRIYVTFNSILVPRGRAPFGQHQESRPQARSKPEVHDSRTSHHSVHAQSQVWQIWLFLVSIYCIYKAIQTGMLLDLNQRSRFLVLTKRKAGSRDENVVHYSKLCKKQITMLIVLS